MTRALVAIGTRPELVKLAPVIRALEARPDFEVQVLFTGQHRELLDQMAETFGIASHRDLGVMRDRQGLAELTGRLVTGLDGALASMAPDFVLGQGDTTTVFATALACFYRNIPFGHVEAGLRTDDLRRPFPEEGNRRLVAPLTRWHFAPTDTAANNLLREGVSPERVHVVGNTVIDSLLAIAPTARPVVDPGEHKLVLLTLHRRESFGAPLKAILHEIRALLLARPDVLLVYPVHPNPEVRGPAEEILGAVPNARLTAPLDYETFIGTMRVATVVLSDSGGVQEEAPALGVPALVLRDTTERPEGVEAGVAWLVGTDPARIREHAERWLSPLPPPRPHGSPYGDGLAAERIASVLAGTPWSPFAWRGDSVTL